MINNKSINECEFLETVEATVEWCRNNYLVLNESKTNEMKFDFRKKKEVESPVIINGSVIDRVNECKYLGIIIDEKLCLKSHVEVVNRKMQKRMYLIKKLKATGINTRLVELAFTSFVESVCRYGFSVISYIMCKKEKRRYFQCIRQAEQMKLRRMSNCIASLDQQTLSFVRKIHDDTAHPLHCVLMSCFSSGRRKWKMPYCRTSRYLNSLIPQVLLMWSRTAV